MFQTCADFKSIRIYLFYALDMVNIFPSANFSSNLKDGAVQGGQPAGKYQTDVEVNLWYDDGDNGINISIWATAHLPLP